MTTALTLALVIAPKTWTLVCGGDLMFNGIKPGKQALASVSSLFRNADVAYANLEIPLTTTKTRTRNKSAADVRAKRQFILKADPRHTEEIKAAGFDLLSLGNNHAMDGGVPGLREMLTLLRQSGIRASGAGLDIESAEVPAVATLKDGTKVGLISYLAFMGSGALIACTPASATSAGVATLPFGGVIEDRARSRLSTIVTRARESCDVLLVALHWGIEKQERPTPYQKSLGRAFIDAGADVILGAHPHVLQGTEVYKGKPILYSLGNLVSLRSKMSAVYKLTFANGKFSSISTYPFSTNSKSLITGPALAVQRRRIAALDKLVTR